MSFDQKTNKESVDSAMGMVAAAVARERVNWAIEDGQNIDDLFRAINADLPKSNLRTRGEVIRAYKSSWLRMQS